MIAKTKYFKRGGLNRKIFFYVLSGTLLLAITLFLISTNLKINQRKKGLDSELAALEKEIRTLEEKNQKLKAEISNEQNENFLEAEARERLGLKKPGEEVVVVLPPEENNAGLHSTTTGTWQQFQTTVSGFFQKILEKLGLRD